MKPPEKIKPKRTRKIVFSDLNGEDFISRSDAEQSNNTIRTSLFVQALDGYFAKFMLEQLTPEQPDPRVEDNNKLVQTIKFDLADNLGNNAEGVMTLIDDVFQKIEKLNGTK